MANLGELRGLLERCCEGLPEVSVRRMFGCDGFFARDTIFGLIWKAGRIGLKLPDPQVFQEAMSLQGSDPWTAGTRVMSQWVLLPVSFHTDPAGLCSWTVRAHTLALTTAAPKKALAKKVSMKKVKK